TSFPYTTLFRSRGRVGRFGNRHAAGEVSQPESAQHLQGPLAVYGQHAESAGASLEDYARRSGESAADFSAHRLYTSSSGQAVPAIPLADSRGDGVAERRQDRKSTRLNSSH